MAARVTLLAAMVIGLLLAAHPALAQPTPADVIRARDEIMSLLKAAEAAGAPPPRLADPKVAALFRTAFDPQAARASRSMALGAQMDFCGGASAIVTTYSLHGLSRIAGAARPGAAREAAAVKLSADNGVAFQDEITPALVFTVDCFSEALTPLAAFAASLPPEQMTPVRKQAIVGLRASASEVFTGAVISTLDGVTTPANRDALLAAAVRNADRYAAAMDAPARINVLRWIGEALPGHQGTVRDGLLKLQKAMSRTDCSGLCAL